MVCARGGGLSKCQEWFEGDDVARDRGQEDTVGVGGQTRSSGVGQP